MVQQLRLVANAESIDDFAIRCKRLFRATMAYHSLYVSFSGLDYFCPWLIRDTLPNRCDVADVTDRYDRLNPTQPFLRQNIGIAQSMFNEQMDTMPPVHRRAYLQRFKRQEGWDKYAEIYFWNGPALQGHICVRRSSDQPDFTRNDLCLLADLREAFSECVSNLHRQHRERLTSNSLHQVLGSLPIPILVLDWDLNPISFNTAARSACADWVHGEAAGRAVKLTQFLTVPAEIVAACQQEKMRLSSLSFNEVDAPERFAPRFRSIAHPTTSGLSAQLEVLEVPRELVGMPNFLVRMQQMNGPARSNDATTQTAPASLATLSCLTHCERQVAILAGRGMPNQDIATRLSKSVPTVKMQLQSIFRKLSVSNRTQIAAILK